MHTENRKKISFILSFILFISVIVPVQRASDKTEAATQKAVIEDVMGTDEFYEDSSNNFVRIWVRNMKQSAVYSVDISDKNIAEFSTFMEGVFLIRVKKAGTFTVTIKENNQGKIRKVGTETITIKAKNRNDYISDSENYATAKYKILIMEENTSIALSELLLYKGKVEMKSEDESIVSVHQNEKIVKAHKIGTATLNFTFEAEDENSVEDTNLRQYTESVEIRVVQQDNGTEMEAGREIAKKINEYCSTTITSKNAEELFNKICALDIKMSEDSSEFIEKIGIYGEPERGIEYQIGSVIIPANYTYDQLLRVKQQCKIAAGINVTAVGVSLEAIQVTKLTPNKVSLKLSHPVTRMESAVLKNQKYSIVLTDKKEQWYHFNANVKKGSRIITGTITNKMKLKAGQTYYAVLSNKNKKTIKTVKVKCKK